MTCNINIIISINPLNMGSFVKYDVVIVKELTMNSEVDLYQEKVQKININT